MDGDFNTAQSASGGGDYDSSVTIVLEHIFANLCTIKHIRFRLFALAHVYGDSEQLADVHYKIEYYSESGWIVVPGSQYDNSQNGNTINSVDSGQTSLLVNLPNCEGIRATCYAHTHSNGDSRTEESSTSIYMDSHLKN